VLDSGIALVDVLVAVVPAIASDTQVSAHENCRGELGDPVAL